ncbi:Putative aspartic-type endopeptidase OPSB [Fusarium oxysporum f. sp. cubense race 1]|uniref:Putative aspartic-type endopeptidase OPSB n=1 Tax=Fusarium oxysporum f. sp. cubense (strain race 1) TaxID=1229664 RepID=N4U4B8_FUSC1|nr:Putative aspartic-type endopeptidase OPSB [Fusarium oxysporum f. sp. cubense race 1]
MKGSSLVLSSTLLSCVNALQLHKRHNPPIVSVNFEKRTKGVFPGHEKRGNDEIAEMKVDQQGVLYWANFTIRNPPQRLSAEIDTGSSDSIILTNQIEICVWEGTYANDTFTLGSSTLESLQFVSVSEYNATTNGITSTFGVGLYTREHAEINYPNFPYALAEAGEINTPAFSLWLDNKTHGEFLFGGVNKAKYTGLLTMKISFDEKLGAVAPCETSSKETLDFTFGDLTIKVSFANFLGSTNVKAGVDGVAYCQVVYYDDATNIMLDDDFLRGTCVFYGWANMEIPLAQYNSEEAEDDILEIIRDVPGASAATGVPRRYLKYDQPAESAGTAIPKELPTVTVTPISTATGSVTSSAALLSTAAETGDVEDSGATGSLLANLMYMMLIAFVFNVVIHA